MSSMGSAPRNDTMAAGHLPAAADDARDFMIRRELVRCIGSLIWQGDGRGRGVAEAAQAGAGDPHTRRAVRVGAGDFGVGGHPVVAVTGPLLGRKKRQHGGEE